MAQLQRKKEFIKRDLGFSIGLLKERRETLSWSLHFWKPFHFKISTTGYMMKTWHPQQSIMSNNHESV